MKSVWLLIPLLLAFGPFESPKGLVEEGNTFFMEEKYDEALEKYDKALGQLEDTSPLQYNRANVLMKKGDREGALKAYREGAASGNDAIKAKSFYNMGNTLFEGQQFGEAVSAYKEALKFDPSDKDAKMNLELALKKVKEQKQQPQGNEGGDNQEEGNKKKEEEKREDGREEQKSPASESHKEEGAEEKSDEDRRADEKKESPDKPSQMNAGERKEMSREEAERLLENLGGENMDLQNMTDMLKKSNPSRVEKDW